jgi:hypothetical protein
MRHSVVLPCLCPCVSQLKILLASIPTDLQVAVLGSAALSPAPGRALGALALCRAKDVWLVDGGDDTQRQLGALPHVRPSKVSTKCVAMVLRDSEDSPRRIAVLCLTEVAAVDMCVPACTFSYLCHGRSCAVCLMVSHLLPWCTHWWAPPPLYCLPPRCTASSSPPWPLTVCWGCRGCCARLGQPA